MKVDLNEVHRKANTELYLKYPLTDMANLEKHPEGHWKLWEIEWIIRTYEELKCDSMKKIKS